LLIGRKQQKKYLTEHTEITEIVIEPQRREGREGVICWFVMILEEGPRIRTHQALTGLPAMLRNARPPAMQSEADGRGGRAEKR